MHITTRKHSYHLDHRKIERLEDTQEMSRLQSRELSEHTVSSVIIMCSHKSSLLRLFVTQKSSQISTDTSNSIHYTSMHVHQFKSVIIHILYCVFVASIVLPHPFLKLLCLSVLMQIILQNTILALKITQYIHTLLYPDIYIHISKIQFVEGHVVGSQ